MVISPEQMVIRHCAYWVSLLNFPESDNETSVTIDIPRVNRFHIPDLQALMQQSRTGRLG